MMPAVRSPALRRPWFAAALLLVACDDAGADAAHASADGGMAVDAQSAGDSARGRDAAALDARVVFDARPADARVAADATALDARVVFDARPADASPPDARPVGDAAPARDAGAADGAPDAAAPADAGAPADAAVILGPGPDLELLRGRLNDDVWIDERDFTADSCAVIEGCVAGPGRRRLLRFDVSTANVGNADLRMGRPEENPALFEYSACHDHYHFAEYARYELQDADGAPLAPGRKQAFCLLDTARYGDDPDAPRRPQYSCEFQGISRGWYDAYHSGLDCQWIDVTDVPPGDYRLQVRINPARVLREKRYDNNDAVVDVTLPPVDLDGPCPERSPDGTRRSCGWTQDQVLRCQPGNVVRVGCNGRGACAPGDGCQGDPMLRVCAGEGTDCLPGTALAQSDDACDSRCPHAELFCPDAGVVTVWRAPARHGAGYECALRVEEAPPPDPTVPCDVGADGLGRLCGWTVAADDAECLPGFEYRVGCNPEGCGIGEACGGDPMVRVCEGGTPCLPHQALGANDDACGSQCPVARFTCPESGRYTVLTAPYGDGDGYRCDVGLVRDL